AGGRLETASNVVALLRNRQGITRLGPAIQKRSDKAAQSRLFTIDRRATFDQQPEGDARFAIILDNEYLQSIREDFGVVIPKCRFRRGPWLGFLAPIDGSRRDRRQQQCGENKCEGWAHGNYLAGVAGFGSAAGASASPGQGYRRISSACS